MSSIFLYGRSGSGKTTLASTMMKLGYIPWFIDMDRKIRTMKNLEEALKAEKIKLTECPHQVDPVTLKLKIIDNLKYYPKKQPAGYLWLADEIDNMKLKPPSDHLQLVPVLDSLTRVNEHLQAFLSFHSKKSKMDFDGWAAVKSNYESLFDTFYSMQPDIYPHCIIIAHAKDDRDEVIQVTETRPLIDGGFRDKTGSYVDEQYFCFVDSPNANSQAKFKVLTKPVQRVMQARTSRKLPTVVEADFETIFKGEFSEAELKGENDE